MLLKLSCMSFELYFLADLFLQDDLTFEYKNIDGISSKHNLVPYEML